MSNGPTLPKEVAESTDNAVVDIRRPRRTALIISATVGVVMALLLVLLAVSPSDPDRATGSVLIGKTAPAFRSVDTKGRTVDAADYRGRWLLVNFFASWCIPCKVEQPELIAWSARHETSGEASLVSIAFDDGPDAVVAFFAANGGDWPVVPDQVARIAQDYGVVKLPESFLISPDGVVVTKFEGGVTADGIDAVMAKGAPGTAAGATVSKGSGS